jgi:asparagine synthase (glutamine-hydrolysing)
MCGILGFVRTGGQCLAEKTFLEARDLMAHRGPDDAGFLNDDPVLLGHRRLSIIDIDGGHQPMSVADGSVWIVFNGEIYNFREIRSELESKGHRFKTRSDTEVILRLFLESGPAGFHRLNGIFAFAIWDRRTRELHLARDHMGVKPLYYAWTEHGLIFASEVKALLASGLVAAKLEQEAIPEYMTFRDVAGERTLFRGVKRLLPGHHIRVAEGRAQIGPFWSVTQSMEPFQGSFEEATDELDRLLIDAVDRQMISDVPLGTFCSGGVDSSLITALAARRASAPVDTFSVGFAEAEYDESRFARMVATHCGTRHHELRVDGREFAEAIEAMIWFNDEPLHFPNSVQIHAVSQLAREHVTVVLTGEGADELFGGYPRYHIPAMVQRWQRIPASARRVLLSLAGLTGDHRPGKLEAFRGLHDELQVILNPAVPNGRAMAGLDIAEPGLLPYRWSVYGAIRDYADPFQRAGLLDQHTYLVSILNRQDKMSMATSIESRVPFLDTRIVSFANALPTTFKRGRLGNKRVLKAVALRYLPSGVVTRPKSGFGVPLGAWFRDDAGLGGLMAEHLENPLLGSVLGEGNVGEWYAEHRQGAVDHSETLWTALNLALWQKAFGVDSGCAASALGLMPAATATRSAGRA